MNDVNFTPKHCSAVDRVSTWTLATDDIGWDDKAVKCDVFENLSLEGLGLCRIYLKKMCVIDFTTIEMVPFVNPCSSVNPPFEVTKVIS